MNRLGTMFSPLAIALVAIIVATFIFNIFTARFQTRAMVYQGAHEASTVRLNSHWAEARVRKHIGARQEGIAL